MTVVEHVFTYTGGRFYMDWLLLTNPKSKNPLIRAWAGSRRYPFQKSFAILSSVHSGRSPRKRLCMAWVFGAGHLIIGIVMYKYTPHLWLLNAYINWYPVIVQIYVGYRCFLRMKTAR